MGAGGHPGGHPKNPGKGGEFGGAPKANGKFWVCIPTPNLTRHVQKGPPPRLG